MSGTAAADPWAAATAGTTSRPGATVTASAATSRPSTVAATGARHPSIRASVTASRPCRATVFANGPPTNGTRPSGRACKASRTSASRSDAAPLPRRPFFTSRPGGVAHCSPQPGANNPSRNRSSVANSAFDNPKGAPTSFRASHRASTRYSTPVGRPSPPRSTRAATASTSRRTLSTSWSTVDSDTPSQRPSSRAVISTRHLPWLAFAISTRMPRRTTSLRPTSLGSASRARTAVNSRNCMPRPSCRAIPGRSTVRRDSDEPPVVDGARSGFLGFLGRLPPASGMTEPTLVRVAMICSSRGGKRETLIAERHRLGRLGGRTRDGYSARDVERRSPPRRNWPGIAESRASFRLRLSGGSRSFYSACDGAVSPRPSLRSRS